MRSSIQGAFNDLQEALDDAVLIDRDENYKHSADTKYEMSGLLEACETTIQHLRHRMK